MSTISQFTLEDLATLKSVMTDDRTGEKISSFSDGEEIMQWFASIAYLEEKIDHPEIRERIEQGSFALALDDGGVMHEHFDRYHTACLDIKDQSPDGSEALDTLSQHLGELLRRVTEERLLIFADGTKDHVLKAILVSFTNTAKTVSELQEIQNSWVDPDLIDPSIEAQLEQSQALKQTFVAAKDWWEKNRERVRKGRGTRAVSTCPDAFTIIYSSAKTHLESLQAEASALSDPKGKGKATAVEKVTEVDWTEHEDPDIAQLAKDVRSLRTLSQSLQESKPSSKRAVRQKPPAPEVPILTEDEFIATLTSIDPSKFGVDDAQIPQVRLWAQEYGSDVLGGTLLQYHNDNIGEFVREHEMCLKAWNTGISSTIDDVRRGEGQLSLESLLQVQSVIRPLWSLCPENAEQRAEKRDHSDEEQSARKALKSKTAKVEVQSPKVKAEDSETS